MQILDCNYILHNRQRIVTTETRAMTFHPNDRVEHNGVFYAFDSKQGCARYYAAESAR